MENLISQKIVVNRGSVTDTRILGAIDLLEWAINEVELREYILNFKNQYKFRSFIQTTESNEKILRRFVQGSEQNSVTDFEWDFLIEFFTSDAGVIGYTEDDNAEINLNTVFLDRNLPELCNTLGHEYCHLVGMSHSFDNPGWEIWKQTAPYAIGQYIQYMIEKKLGLEPKPPFFPTVSLRRRVAYRVKRFFRRLFA